MLCEHLHFITPTISPREDRWLLHELLHSGKLVSRSKRLKPFLSWLETFHEVGQVPVERFEPSTPHGDLFLRQARIPFRHTGL